MHANVLCPNKENGGCSLCHTPISLHTFPPLASTSEDSWSNHWAAQPRVPLSTLWERPRTPIVPANEMSPASSIGSSLSASTRRFAWADVGIHSDPSTPSSPSLRLHERMSGRMTQQSPEPVSSWGIRPFDVITIQIGRPYATTLEVDGWRLSRHTSTCNITATSVASLLTICNLLQSNEKLLFSGAEPDRESLDARGWRLGWTRIQKILALNSGMGIEVTRMLSSTSFVEGLTSHISSDGSTDIRLLLK